MQTLLTKTSPKDHRCFDDLGNATGARVLQTHYFGDLDQLTHSQSNEQNESILLDTFKHKDIIDDIQGWFGLSDMERDTMVNLDIAQFRGISFELCFWEDYKKEITDFQYLIFPKIRSVLSDLPTITYIFQTYIDYDGLHEVFNWEDTRTIQEIMDDKEINVPWGEDVVREYESATISWSFNQKYGTEIEPEDITSIELIKPEMFQSGVYEFQVLRQK